MATIQQPSIIGLEVSAASQHGVYILVCIFGEIGYLRPVFCTSRKLKPYVFYFQSVCFLIDYTVIRHTCLGHRWRIGRGKVPFPPIPYSVFSKIRFILVTVRPFPENGWVIQHLGHNRGSHAACKRHPFRSYRLMKITGHTFHYHPLDICFKGSSINT